MDFFTVATIGLHMVSVHLPARDHNDFNPGVYVVNEQGYVAGGYYNTQRRASFYLGRSFEVYGTAVSLTIGGVTGYDYGPVTPLVAPSIKWGNFRITGVPRVGGVTDSAALHLSTEWRF